MVFHLDLGVRTLGAGANSPLTPVSVLPFLSMITLDFMVNYVWWFKKSIKNNIRYPKTLLVLRFIIISFVKLANLGHTPSPDRPRLTHKNWFQFNKLIPSSHQRQQKHQVSFYNFTTNREHSDSSPSFEILYPYNFIQLISWFIWPFYNSTNIAQAVLSDSSPPNPKLRCTPWHWSTSSPFEN